MLLLGLFFRAVFDEPFDLLDFGGYLHHPEITNLFGSLNGSELKIFSETNDDRVETESKEELFLEIIGDLHDRETVFLSNAFSEY